MVKKDKAIFWILMLLVISIFSVSIFWYLKTRFQSNYANTVKIHTENVNVQNLTMKVGEVRNFTLRGDGRARLWFLTDPENQKNIKVHDNKGKELEEAKVYLLYFKKTFKIEAVSKGTVQLTFDWDPIVPANGIRYLGWIENRCRKILNIEIV